MPTPWRRRLSRIALAIVVVVAVLALPWALAALWPGPWLPRQWDSPIIIAVAADAALVLLAAIWWLWWRLPQALGGAVVLIGAVVVYLQFTQQQQPAYRPILPQQRAAEGSRKAANDLLISDQVSKGSQQLAGKETAMRLGGIDALEGVLNTSEQYHQPVLEALCAFVRDSTTHQQVTLTTFLAALFPARRDKTAGKGDGTPPATDVQAALTVIGRRKTDTWARGVNIPRVDLSEAQLADAYLMDADLEGATLYEAHLEGAILAGAHLEGSDLSLAQRSVGRDGKTYPGSYHPPGSRDGRPHTALSRDLGMARHAVRRLARATAFSPDDLAELRTIASEAGALLQEWTVSVEAEEHARLRIGP